VTEADPSQDRAIDTRTTVAAKLSRGKMDRKAEGSLASLEVEGESNTTL